LKQVPQRKKGEQHNKGGGGGKGKGAGYKIAELVGKKIKSTLVMHRRKMNYTKEMRNRVILQKKTEERKILS